MRDTDQFKRRSLKRIAAGSIAAATSTALLANPSSGANSGLQPSGISVSICDHSMGQVVLITNESDVARELKAIQPFKIYTKDGFIDLRKVFSNGSLRVAEHSTQAFEVAESGEISRHASWRALVPTNNISYPVAKLQPVNVISSVTGEYLHRRNRQHLALFA